MDDSSWVQINALLQQGRKEHSRELCKLHLENALEVASIWYKRDQNEEAAVATAITSSELAYEECQPADRNGLWKSSVEVLKQKIGKNCSSRLVEAYANIVVDCTQDSLTSLSNEDKGRLLRTAKKDLTDAIRVHNEPEIKSRLLVRKASVLRHLALTSITKSTGKDLRQEAFGCAEKAEKLHASPSAILELALSHWAYAECEQTDEEYSERLEKAQTFFLDERIRDDELTLLSLSRFYRSTYNPLEVCEIFPNIANSPSNLRRYLRESHIYAEAAIQLWYRKLPESLVNKHLSAAKDLIENTIAAGYTNARNLIDLAFIRAIFGGQQSGRIVLEGLCDRKNIAWNKALRIATLAEIRDPLEYGFALGIDQSSVWSMLGTYILEFESDIELSRIMYETGRKLNPKNPIVLTNLARLIVLHGSSEELSEAERILQTAEQFSDRRFRWWSSVREALINRKINLGLMDERRPVLQKLTTEDSVPLKNLREIKKSFKLIEAMENHQDRGYELESLFEKLASITFRTSSGSYRNTRVNRKAKPQIDGYFEHDGRSYRVECKWEAKPTPPNDIWHFMGQIDVAGVYGLFISMSGFTESAIEMAQKHVSTKPIMLMDGDEAKAVFKGQRNLDDLVSQKRTYLDRKSIVYFKTKPIEGW